MYYCVFTTAYSERKQVVLSILVYAAFFICWPLGMEAASTNSKLNLRVS